MEIYGHRGAKGVTMENSLTGFQVTANQGIDRFELDVRLSSDGQLMVIHDEKLKRLTGTSLMVSKTTASDLQQTLLNGTREGIPTLEDIVKACPNVMHWQFEIKTDKINHGFVKPMADLIEKYQLQDKVAITSKHIGTLRAFKQSLPNIARGYVQEWPMPNGLKTALNLECRFLCLNKALARETYIKQAQAKGLHVSIWTVNLSDDMVHFQKLGANSIISDFPQNAREVLNPITQAS